jgi:hypothetical protein
VSSARGVLLEAMATPELEAAGKSVDASVSATSMRLVIYSTQNLNSIPTGPLVDVALSSQRVTTEIDISTERPIFAPAEANHGLQISPPLKLTR